MGHPLFFLAGRSINAGLLLPNASTLASHTWWRVGPRSGPSQKDAGGSQSGRHQLIRIIEQSSSSSRCRGVAVTLLGARRRGLLTSSLIRTDMACLFVLVVSFCGFDWSTLYYSGPVPLSLHPSLHLSDQTPLYRIKSSSLSPLSAAAFPSAPRFPTALAYYRYIQPNNQHRSFHFRPRF